MSETTQFSPAQRIESDKEFKKTPGGWYRKWSAEMVAANKRIKRWHKQGFRIQARYQDRRGVEEKDYAQDNSQYAFRVNLFHSNVSTLNAMIYGNTPKVDVSRRYADPADDQARVASVILDRMLNTDIESSGDDTTSVLGYCLEDRLLPGFGLARVRYEYESEIDYVEDITDPETGEVIEEGFEQEKITDERAPIEYVHWDDVRWGWARTWSEVPWLAFRTWMDKDQVEKRFGKTISKELTYKNKTISSVEDKRFSSDEITDAWDRAEVWEIWDKKTQCVYWWSAGFERIMDKKKDPLKLFGFWPCPEPLLANTTTSLLLPQPDFSLAQDLYNQIDQLETRIAIITTAVKVVGVYNSAEDGIKRMMQEGMDNELIPIENWAAFSEGGAIDGAVSWMPIAEIAATLGELVKQRTDAMSLLYEVTNMSEIMRGANGPDRETAEAASGKRQFASVRVQGLSEDFARFASDLMSLKAEIIAKHFSPETIIRRSNILLSTNAEEAQLAVELIKQPEDSMWRIKIQPESMAMLDYQALKKDRIEFIQALSTFMTAAMPLAELDENAMAPLLQILKWTMSGFKGSNEIEGVLDKAIDGMLKAQKESAGKPDKDEKTPEQLKMEVDSAKHQQTMELQQAKHQNAMNEEVVKFQNTLKELQAEMQKEIKVIAASMKAEIQQEIAQSQAAIIQDEAEMKNQMEVDDNKARHTHSGGES